MQIEFSPRSFVRNLGLPNAKLSNMFYEATPGGPGQTARYSRPGLASGVNYGTGPNRGLFLGVFNTGFYTVSGNGVYQGANLLGAIDGTDLVRSATSKDQRVFVANNKGYLFDSNGFNPIIDPNFPTCIDVIYFAGRFIYFQAGSGRYYYSLPDDAANIDGLAFENAELRPDFNVGALAVGDLFYIFGTGSTEPTFATGDANTPFERAEGRSFERGCAGRDTIRLVDNTAFWLGDDRVVYRAANVPERISSHYVEGLLKACANISNCVAMATSFEGHPWYILNIPGQGTVVYDISTSEWDDWRSYQHDVFRACGSVDLNGVTYFGDDTTNDVWIATKGVFTDGGNPLIREATAFAPVEGNRPRCDQVALSCAKGVGAANGNGVIPFIEMRFSDDQGRTFSRWRAASPGVTGDYGQRVSWSRLGRMRAPGRLFEFRCADPVLASFANLSINGGRA